MNLYDLRRATSKINGWLSGKRSCAPSTPGNLYIEKPFLIPYNHIDFCRRLNKLSIIRTINGLSFKPSEGYHRILITTWPFMGNIIGHMGERLSIYYRVDDFAEFPGVRKDTILKLEDELIRKVDMVIATAEDLTKINADANKAFYLPHGVDFEHFSQRYEGDSGTQVMRKIPQPRIGFFGLLSSWLDFDLLRKLAEKNASWSFVFIGSSQLPQSELPDAENIHYIGPVPYDKLPEYAQSFDVALIPFKINKLTLPVNPLKLMEYLAMGLPVISTPLPEVTKYRDYVAIASDQEGFAKAIQKALSENDPSLRAKRQLVAKGQSWQAKADQLLEWVVAGLENQIVGSK